MGTISLLERERSDFESFDALLSREMVVLVVEDRAKLSRSVGYICDFLGVAMERIDARSDLASVLENTRPFAVVCELDGGTQDGCHVMKLVAEYDARLPVLLVTGSDPSLIGAAEAVQEIWGLSSVTKLQDNPGLGDVVEFLFRTGRLQEPENALAV